MSRLILCSTVSLAVFSSTVSALPVLKISPVPLVEDAPDNLIRDVADIAVGIGVELRRDLFKDALLVITPIKGGPAYAAGIRAGDYISKIRRDVSAIGEKLDPPQEFSTKGMQVRDALKLISGKPGTKIKVVVERPGTQEKEIELTRQKTEMETVLGYQRKPDDSWDYYIDAKSKVAYIHLTRFARNSFVDMEQAIKQLDKDGVKCLILDLRFNPGGYLNVASDICDLFIDDGLIVTIKPRVGEVFALKGKKEPSYLSFPMVCLVNGESAMVSEMLGACLQDHRRAVIMGARSFGKGSIQTTDDFPATGGQIKLTTALFWRPNGKKLDRMRIDGTDEDDWGVKPDKPYAIELSRQETIALSDRLHNWVNIPNREIKNIEPEKKFEDRQLDAALHYLREQSKKRK